MLCSRLDCLFVVGFCVIPLNARDTHKLVPAGVKAFTEQNCSAVRHRVIIFSIYYVKQSITLNFDNSVHTPPPAVFCLSGH